MTGLSKDDLAQMSRDYFQSLEKERLVEVADNLHRLAVEQWEKINSNSSNSSQPPSGDNPFEKPNSSSSSTGDSSKGDSESTASFAKNLVQQQQVKESKSKRKPGRQKGSKGFGCSKPVSIAKTIPHYPNHCSACNQALRQSESKPYMGHHVLELETTESRLQVVCQLHHYYQSSCSCGHQSQSKPGVGITSEIEGRSRDLKLSEYVLVGSNLASLIASLGVRYRLSRVKIREFLADCFGVSLSVGTIDRCIREAGIACEAVVEELLVQLQQASILHSDETPWYQKGKLYWLWVAIESKTKPELEKIIRSLQGVCHLAKTVKHKKLKALASEILNVGRAVVAAVNNPDLPLTNNEAERALRHAVIARRISYGTRTHEGSIAYSCLLSVIETCRLRQVNPWAYISSVIKLARKGLSPPLLPSGVVT